MVKKTPKPLDCAQKEAVLLLRYHNSKPAHDAPPFMKMTRIAVLLDLPLPQVRRACTRKRITKKKKKKPNAAERVLEDQHIAYLTDDATL